jgi:flagellar hook-associated protein 1 FlgK
MSATPAESTTGGYIGSGVTVTSIQRIRNGFLDTQIRSTNSTLGESETSYSILSQIETAVNEPSDEGISTALSTFFTSFQNLANNPEDSSARTTVVEDGKTLANNIQQLYSSMTSQQSDLATDSQSQIDSINTFTSEIATYDKQIIAAQANGSSANDLLDKRDYAIQQLSELTKISSSVDSNGSATVSINGVVVASANGSVDLTENTQNGKITVTAANSSTALNITSGKLGADLTAYNTTIPAYQDKLNTLASAIITQVNALHSTGYGIDDSKTTGTAFFTGSSASDIAVNSTLENNTDLVAASADGTTGNNSVALAISELADSKVMNSNSTTISGYYTNFVSSLGTDVASAENSETTQTLVLQQLQEQQSSVSGVSTDEETTNLIQYQRAYQAAAQVVTTVNSLFQTVLDMMA